MQLPIESFNTKRFEPRDVQVSSDHLHFMLPSSEQIRIITCDQPVADFLGISCTKLGYISDEEMKQQ